MTNNGETPVDRWHGLKGHQIVLGLLQVDIVGHSKMVGTEGEKSRAKQIFGEAVKAHAIALGGKQLDWAGDGGCFMFLPCDKGIDDLVLAAIKIWEEMPQLNEIILRETELKEPIRVRISCHSGVATYRDNPELISGDFINSFLKHERAVGFPDTVRITEPVHRELRASLKNKFEWQRHSEELDCEVYELRRDKSLHRESVRSKPFPNWIFLIAPLLAILIVFILNKQPRFVTVVGVGVILITGIFLHTKSKRESIEGQSLSHSLLKDELLAPKTGRPLVFQAKAVIVEDEKQKLAFFLRIEQDFTGPDEPDDSNLILVPFTCQESQRKADKEKLELTLDGANAVVVVWTKELRDKSWVYDTIDSWAIRHSEVPILFALTDSSIPKPKKYFNIPEESKSLPWRLMQRGNERARDWRWVANFNRTVAGILLLLLFMVASFAVILVLEQRRARQNTAREIFQGIASNVKKDFLNSVVTRNNGSETPLDENDFHVSFWFSECGEVRQFASTETGQGYKSFDLDEVSAISTAFACGTCVTDARRDSSMRVWDVQNNQKPDVGAKMYPESNKDRRLVACASHGPDPSDPKSTVGICVFSNQDYVTLDEVSFRVRFREEAQKLFDRAGPQLADGGIGALPENAKWKGFRRVYRCVRYGI